MGQTAVFRTIQAPVDTVFDNVAHIENFSKAVPHLIDVEFLGEQRSGVGTRFRETRMMGKRKASTELEVTEYVKGERVRMVSDAGGTIWDSLFTTSPTPDGSGTELRLVMDARPHTLLARLMTPLIGGMVRKAVEQDMDAIKNYCEAGYVSGDASSPD